MKSFTKLSAIIVTAAVLSTQLTAFAATTIAPVDTFAANSMNFEEIYNIDFTTTTKTVADIEDEGWSFSDSVATKEINSTDGLKLTGVNAVIQAIYDTEETLTAPYKVTVTVGDSSGHWDNDAGDIYVLNADKSSKINVHTTGKQDWNYCFTVTQVNGSSNSGSGVKYDNAELFTGKDKTKNLYTATILVLADKVQIEYKSKNITTIQEFTYDSYQPIDMGKFIFQGNNDETSNSKIRIKQFSIEKAVSAYGDLDLGEFEDNNSVIASEPYEVATTINRPVEEIASAKVSINGTTAYDMEVTANENVATKSDLSYVFNTLPEGVNCVTIAVKDTFGAEEEISYNVSAGEVAVAPVGITSDDVPVSNLADVAGETITATFDVSDTIASTCKTMIVLYNADGTIADMVIATGSEAEIAVPATVSAGMTVRAFPFASYTTRAPLCASLELTAE